MALYLLFQFIFATDIQLQQVKKISLMTVGFSNIVFSVFATDIMYMSSKIASRRVHILFLATYIVYSTLGIQMIKCPLALPLLLLILHYIVKSIVTFATEHCFLVG